MIIVDTSVWIAFLRKDDPDVADMLKVYLKRDEIYAVSAVFGELFQGVKSSREYHIVAMLWKGLPKAKEENLFIRAGSISGEQKLHSQGVGLIDCYILSAALENKMALWTLDKKLGAVAERILSR